MSDLLLTAEELREKRARRRRLIVIAALIVAVLVGGYFAARPTRDAIKGWQARRHAAKAFAFIEQSEWNEARAAAVAAIQLRPSEPTAIRAVARLLSRTRQVQALEFWDRLAETTTLTAEDRRDEASVALAAGETERAARAVATLVGEGAANPEPRDWLLATQVYLQQGATEKALAAAAKASAHPAASRREQLQATLLRAQAAGLSGDPERGRKVGEETLAQLARFSEGNDDVALDALVLLARNQLAGGTAAVPSREEGEGERPTFNAQRSTSKGETVSAAAIPDNQSQITNNSARLAERLEEHPLTGPAQKLIAVDLRMQEQPAEKAALIDAAIARWKNADAEALAVLATWLNGHREFERSLSEIPIAKALGSRALFLQHMDALGALGRWGEIKQLLGNERYPLEPFMQRMYLARTNTQLGEETAAQNNWQRALEAAQGDVGKLMTLAEYAEKNGANDFATAAYEAALRLSPALRPAHQGRLRLARAARDTKRMHAILAGMLPLWPNDPAIQNDEAYLRLLRIADGPPRQVNSLRNGGATAVSSGDSERPTPNVQRPTPKAEASVPADGGTAAVSSSLQEELKSIEKLAETLVERDPRSLPHRTLLALARLKQNRPADALKVYEGIQAAPNALTPSALVVHAAVLAANGQDEASRAEVAQIPHGTLLEEESNLTGTQTAE